MVINYCFTVYNEPELLRHTILRLQHPNARFFIHIDRRVDESVFYKALDGIENIEFIKDRVISQWADISTVQAVMYLFRAAIKDDKEGYCVLLSGSDYPLKTANQIVEILTRHYPQEFIHASNEKDWNYQLKSWMNSHIYSHWLTVDGKIKLVVKPYRCVKLYGLGTLKGKQIVPFIYKLFRPRMLGRVVKCFFSKREMPAGLTAYASETWFQITTDAAKYVLKYIDSNPDVLNFYETFGFPEESMMQSIILSNPIFNKRWAGDFLSLIKRTSSDPIDSLRLLPESFGMIKDGIADNKIILTRKVSWKDKAVIEYIDKLVDERK